MSATYKLTSGTVCQDNINPKKEMKARRKSDGKIIEVEAAVYNMKNGEPYHKCISDGHHYPTSDLDFNLDGEETVISGWICRDKKDNALNLHA